MLPNNPRIRAALYLLTLTLVVLATVLKHVHPGPWADAALDLELLFGGPTAITALTNLFRAQPPAAPANQAGATKESD